MPSLFKSAREGCRFSLRSARTEAGQFIPRTVGEILAELRGAGLAVERGDIEGVLRELVAAGEAIEIDAQAGFRWAGPAE